MDHILLVSQEKLNSPDTSEPKGSPPKALRATDFNETQQSTIVAAAVANAI